MKNFNLLTILFLSISLTSCDISINTGSNTSSDNVSSEIDSYLSISSSELVSSEESSYSYSLSESSSSSSSLFSSSYYSSSSLSNFSVKEDGKYTDVESVAMYIVTFHKLPSNYILKSQADDYDNSYSIGGDYFGNKEGYLPSSYNGCYRECDINAKKNSRGKKRIVYEIRTYRIFYSEDHYNNYREYYGYKSWGDLFGKSNDIY